MVNADSVGERPGPPAFHPGHQYGHDIDAATLERHVTADVLKALAPEHLTRAGHMIPAAEAVVVGDSVFTKRATSDAKLRVHGELAQKVLEVIGNKRKVGIKTAHDVEGETLHAFEPGVEC